MAQRTRNAASLTRGGILLLAAVFAPNATADTNPIGGDAIIPINPNFSPETQLLIPGANPGDPPIDFLDNPVSAFLGLDQSLQVSITVPVALGAALSQAISAGNRPSVLTPYSGILYGAGEDAVFDTFGSMVTNKATTLGKGKLGIGLSYQHSKFDEYDGQDIGQQVRQDTETVQNIDSFASTPFGDFDVTTVQPFRTVAKIRAYDVEFKADVITLALTYGLLENLDIGALIPYIYLQASGKVAIEVEQSIQVNASNPSIPLDITFPEASSKRKYKGDFDNDYDGIGDIILFSKWQIVSEDGLPKRIKGPVDLALQTEVKLPTGNEDDFLGTGKTDVAMRMLIQRSLTDRIRLRGELGYNYSGLGSEFNTTEFKVGGEFLIPGSENIAASVEMIGAYSKAFHGVVDIAAGAKYSMTRNFKVFAGVRAPLNDNGLRYAWSPILGIEYVFSKSQAATMANLEPNTGLPATDGAAVASAVAPAGTAATMQPAAFEPRAAAAPVAAGGPLALQPVESLHIVGEQPAARP